MMATAGAIRSGRPETARTLAATRITTPSMTLAIPTIRPRLFGSWGPAGGPPRRRARNTMRPLIATPAAAISSEFRPIWTAPTIHQTAAKTLMTIMAPALFTIPFRWKNWIDPGPTDQTRRKSVLQTEPEKKIPYGALEWRRAELGALTRLRCRRRWMLRTYRKK